MQMQQEHTKHFFQHKYLHAIVEFATGSESILQNFVLNDNTQQRYHPVGKILLVRG